MYTATNRDTAEAGRVDCRSAVLRMPWSVQLQRWLTKAWTEREQRRIERLVLEIGHPGVIAEMRRARERRDGFAAWN
jgi:hypothetical protein